MGSGKSVLIAELCDAKHLEPGACIVVTCPSIRLVEQLHATIAARTSRVVGMYYTRCKDTDADVLICCAPSAPRLAERMTRTVALWVADECHGTAAPTLRAAADAFGDCARVGFSATPYRADERDGLPLYTDLAYSYTPADALADGVIVPFEVEYPPESTPATATTDGVCIDWIKARHADLGPGLVNARSIADADAFVAQLDANGIRAAAVHSAATDDDALDRLRTGDLDCVVHVNMLAEGVDLPWLRWLCMRRPVKSRVRFAQEVGRVLRSCEGKTHATLFDPCDLFDLHGLTADAALGWDEGARQAADDVEAEAPPERGQPLDSLVLLGRVDKWLRRTRIRIVAEGMADAPPRGSWRKNPISNKQARLIEKLAPARLRLAADDARREWLHRARQCAHAGSLLSGSASDLICVMITLQRRGALPETAA